MCDHNHEEHKHDHSHEHGHHNHHKPGHGHDNIDSFMDELLQSTEFRHKTLNMLNHEEQDQIATELAALKNNEERLSHLLSTLYKAPK